MRQYDLPVFLQAEFPSSEPLVEGLLYKEQNSLLVATQKAGKTIISCQLALCVAHGLDFLRWRVPQARKVLYFAFEGSDGALQKRLRRQATGLGISTLSKNLVLFRTPYLFLAREEVLSELQALFTTEKPDLVVFDPLYRLLYGGSITKDEVVMPMTGALMALSMEHHHATWLPTHEHRVKHDTFGSQYELPAQKYAGSYVLAAWCDSMFGVTLDPRSRKATFVSHFERDEEDPRDTLHLTLTSEPDRLIFELVLADKILLELPRLIGMSLRAAARELGASPETFRTTAQMLMADKKLTLHSLGAGKETVIEEAQSGTL